MIRLTLFSQPIPAGCSPNRPTLAPLFSGLKFLSPAYGPGLNRPRVRLLEHACVMLTSTLMSSTHSSPSLSELLPRRFDAKLALTAKYSSLPSCSA